MDKTFAETQGQPAFDWNKWLDAAIANPEAVTHQDWLAKQRKASNWVACACGNQCAIIPRCKEQGPCYGAPEDDSLWQLGVDFYMEVFRQDWNSAKLTLEMIEARSAVLIAEQLAALKANQEGRR